MKLTREQRARLFAGDYAPLTFEQRPACEAGSTYVLSWSNPRPVADGLGSVFRPDPEPLLWITVTSVARRAKGGWSVRFDVTDRRQPRRLPRATPPVYDPELMRQDNVAPPTQAEIAAAAEESSYTSNPGAAIDHLDAPSNGRVHPDTAALRRRQKQQLDQAQRQRLSIGRQLDSLLADAHESRVDVRNRASKIQREIELLQRDLRERDRAA